MNPDITRILNAVDEGDSHAAEELLPLVYNELRRLAAQRMASESDGHTLQPTALVHEAYLRLLGPEDRTRPLWDGRGHFFAAAAESMRRILIDRARARAAVKRGGLARKLTLNPDELTLESVPAELLDFDEALQQLAAECPEKAELVKLRFFAGLSIREAAAVLGISPATADRPLGLRPRLALQRAHRPRLTFPDFGE